MKSALRASLWSILVAGATAASAQPATDDGRPSNTWQLDTVVYVWVASVKGQTDVIGPAQPVGLDLSYGDVLDAFKFAFMGAAEARKDRIVILGDLTFFHLGTTKGIDIHDLRYLEAELDSRSTDITLVGGYRVANKGPVIVDLFAGGRLNFLGTTLQLDGPNVHADGKVQQTWFDPLIAARLQAPLGDAWSFSFYGDVGGVIAGSDLTGQMIVTVQYRLNRKMSLGGGWRYFKVDYDKGDFLYDVRQSGPILTLRTRF